MSVKKFLDLQYYIKLEHYIKPFLGKCFILILE